MSRTDCPSQDTLSDFVLGKLPILEQGTVAEHLDVCLDCERKTELLDGVADAVVSQLRRVSDPDTKATGDSTDAAGSSCLGPMPRASESWGEFRIVREIGRGGMGVVCEAYQGSLNRHVALKFLPEHGNVARFRREAQAAGRLHHTNIVPVFGVGEQLGRHFYVMQFIAGRGLDAVSKERAAAAGASLRSPARLRALEVARIGMQVAEALAEAHGQGVIHRDIKPSNLLLDDQGTVWVTDFGLAKVADQQDLTGTGDFLGTLRYMPPEAFDGRYDARGDVYALGVTLYELLANRPAYDETDRARLIRLVAAENPRRLRDLDREIPRDLETVIHKAIERNPGHRYQTAALLAEDLKLFIADRPIRSRRIGEMEKFTRWCRRNPVPAGLLAALVLVFLVGFVGVVWEWREAVAERGAKEKQVVKANAAADRALGEEKKALDAADRAGRRLYFSLIDRARLENQAANIAEAGAILDRCEPARRGWEWHFLKRLDNAELLTLRGHDGGWVDAVACSPDGKWIATAGGGNPYFENPNAKVVPGTVVVWDAETGRPAHTLRDHKHLVREIAFSRDSRLVASSSLDGTVQLHEAATGHLVRTLVAGSQLLAMAPDGRRLATGFGDGTVAIWDLATGVRAPLLPAQVDGYARAAFSPDGRWLATLSSFNREFGGTVRVWDAPKGAEVARLERRVLVSSLAVSPNSRTLATGSIRGDVQVWDLADGKLLQTLTGHEGWVLGIAFSPDGVYLASAGQDRTVRLWEAGSGTSVRVIRGHTDIVTCVAFSPDGDRLVTGSQDQTARVWDLTFVDETGNRDYGGFHIDEAPEAIAFGRGGREYRVFGRNGIIDREETGSFGDLIEIAIGLPVPWRTPAEVAAFDAEGQRIVGIDRFTPREAVCLDLEGGTRRTILRGHSLEIHHATLSADGTRAATAASTQTAGSRDEVFVWDIANGSVLHRREVAGEAIARVALDPTGRRLALSGSRAASTVDGPWSSAASFVAVVDVDTGRELMRQEVVDDRCLALGFRADGRRLAAAGIDRTVLIWDLKSGGAALRSRQGPEQSMDLAFSPDGRRLAVASRKQVKLVDTETAEEVLTLRGRAQHVPNTHGFNPRVRFSPDGRSLLAICHDLSEPLAVWYSPQDDPGEPAARQRLARRRAVTRHLALAERFPSQRGPERLIALDHLDHVERLGLESPLAFMTWASFLARFDLGGEATAYLDRAVSLAPDDDEILERVAFAWALNGRFHGAGVWYARMSSLPPRVGIEFWAEHGVAFVLAGDHARYRQLCAEVVRRLASNQDRRPDPSTLAYVSALGPDSTIDADTRIRIAQKGYDSKSAEKDESRRFWPRLALGAAHLRAGAVALAKPIFREAHARASDELSRAVVAAWLAIATWHQGHRNEAKSWFDRADRFVRERVPGIRPELEHPPPQGVSDWDWFRLLIAWREAQGLTLDADFPADPFAR